MDSLITTVIAVALIAVTVLLGVTMGGDVILSYQSKAEASQIISDAQTIAAAWRAFARGNNGNPTLTDYCWGNSADGGAGDLVTAYLSRLPTPPPGAADNTVNYYYPALVANYGTNGSGTKVGPTLTPADSVALQLKSSRVCSAIAVQAGYSGASVISSLTTGFPINLTSATTRRPYDCLFVDTAGTGGPAQGDAMLFIYRVFDQNIFTTSARSACS